MEDTKKQKDRGLKRKNDPAGKSKSPKFRRSLAVVIGIDQYSNGIPPLSTAVNDADKLAKILKEKHGYEVILLLNEEANKLLINENTDKSGIRKVFLDKKISSLDENDRFLFYFAGHGVATDGNEGPAGFLIPQDATLEEKTFWPMTDLHEALEALQCRHMLAILDCCFAGSFRWSSKRDFQPLPPVVFQERFERFIRDPAWQVITSAAHDQKALDILSGKVLSEQGKTHQKQEQHSPFAQALFKALKDGAADTTPKGGDGIITATELYLYLRDKVEIPAQKKADHRQSPGIWPLNKHRQGEFIFLTREYDKLNLPKAPELTEKLNPYKGLEPYENTKSDIELFFGRKTLVKKLKRRVAKLPFTVVLGASGTGKSSLVKAGLLPALAKDAESGKEQWFIPKEVMRPGADPLPTLHSLLIRELPDVPSVRSKDISLTKLVGKWSEKNPGQKLLLIIDQFEELITLCREEQAREDFIRELRQALEKHSKVLRIVLTLRSDFEAQISQNYLKDCQQRNNRFVVPPMTQDELREVIEEPASLRVLYFEPRKLIDDLINEVVQTPGSLPLLSFTLSELYRRYVERQKDVKRRDGNRALTKADYEDMGGIIGSLRSHIEEEYEGLDSSQEKTMRRILLRMVAFEGGELARRQAPKWEFAYPDADEHKQVGQLLESLSKDRLIIEDERKDSRGNAEPYYEAVHDSLIVAWDKMFEWRDNEAEKMLLHRQLTRATADWRRGESEKERKALLWDNSPRLLRVQEFLEQESFGGTEGGTKVERKQQSFRLLRQFCKNLCPSFAPLDQYVWLNRVETDFVRRSIERKRNWTWRFTGIVLAVFLSLSAITYIARKNEHEARYQLAMNYWNNGVKERDAKKGNLRKALHYFARAEKEIASLGDLQMKKNIRFAQNFIHRNKILLKKIIKFKSKVHWRINNDGSRILTWNDDGTAYVLDSSTGEPLTPTMRHQKAIRGAVFNHNESRILTWSDDGTARVWSSTTGKALTPKLDHKQPVWHAQFNNDEASILSWSKYGTTRIWDSNTGDPLTPIMDHKGSVKGVFLNHEKKIVLTWGAGLIRIWNSITGNELFSPLKYEKNNYKISSDGNSILILHEEDNLVHVWNSSTGDSVNIEPQIKDEDEDDFIAIFNHDASRVITWVGSFIHIWDSITGEESFPPMKNEYIPDDDFDDYANLTLVDSYKHYVLTYDTYHKLQIWDFSTGKKISLDTWMERAFFNNDGNRILTWSGDSADVWNSNTGKRLFPTLKHQKKILGAVFNHDESRILTWSEDRTARVWDSNTGDLMPFILETEGGYYWQAMFSNDGSHILTWSEDRTARVWASNAEKTSVTLEHKKHIQNAVFSKDESRILTWNEAGTARVWDSITGNALTPELNHKDVLVEAVFSSDGDRVLTWSLTINSGYGLYGTVRIWNSITGKLLTTLLENKDQVEKTVFAIDGSRFLTLGLDVFGSGYATATIWDSITGKALPLALGQEGYQRDRNALFSNDGSRVLTWEPHGLVRVWDSFSGDLLFPPLKSTDVLEGALFSNDGDKFLTWTSSGSRVWSSTTGKPLTPLAKGRDGIYGAVFNSDGSRILAWNGEENFARVWDSISGEQVSLMLKRFEWKGKKTMFSPDGSHILTWSVEGVRVLDSNTGKLLTPMIRHKEGSSLRGAMFNNDESRIFTWSEDGTGRIWDISVDTAWPSDKMVLKTEVETGTTLDKTGDLKVLNVDEWQKKKCQYDKIRHRIYPKRMSKEEWQISQRLCDQLKSVSLKEGISP